MIIIDKLKNDSYNIKYRKKGGSYIEDEQLLDFLVKHEGLNSSEKLTIVYLWKRGYLSTTRYQPLLKKKIIANKLSLDASTVGKGIKNGLRFGILLKNDEDAYRLQNDRTLLNLFSPTILNL